MGTSLASVFLVIIHLSSFVPEKGKGFKLQCAEEFDREGESTFASYCWARILETLAYSVSFKMFLEFSLH